MTIHGAPSTVAVVLLLQVPEGLTADEVDAAGDGEVLAVLDLRVDAALQLAGLAREVVSRSAPGLWGPRVALDDAAEWG